MSAAPARLRTARLHLERIAPEHVPALSGLLRDPRVAATLSPDGLPPDEADARQRLEADIGHWARHDFGPWAARDRDTLEIVGRGGLRHLEDEVEVLWTVVPTRWNAGLATELARASVRTGLGVLGFTRLIADTLPDNHPSRRVMEKAGFTFDRNVRHAGLPHVRYICRR